MSNPVRPCLGCGQSDDHPRHVIDLDGQNVANWHHDCHSVITNCELCAPIVKGAKGKTGDDLRNYIIEKG
jgi:hypothetical protein